MEVWRAVSLTSRIVIIGAGFGGLACARALRGANAGVTVVDRQNYHLFAPLLYQVATAALSPADIAVPIRRKWRRSSAAPRRRPQGYLANRTNTE
jgi:NADH dehydrogenase